MREAGHVQLFFVSNGSLEGLVLWIQLGKKLKATLVKLLIIIYKCHPASNATIEKQEEENWTVKWKYNC